MQVSALVPMGVKGWRALHQSSVAIRGGVKESAASSRPYSAYTARSVAVVWLSGLSKCCRGGWFESKHRHGPCWLWDAWLSSDGWVLGFLQLTARVNMWAKRHKLWRMRLWNDKWGYFLLGPRGKRAVKRFRGQRAAAEQGPAPVVKLLAWQEFSNRMIKTFGDSQQTD